MEIGYRAEVAILSIKHFFFSLAAGTHCRKRKKPGFENGDPWMVCLNMVLERREGEKESRWEDT